jgi:hypothetical protein
VVVAAVCVPHAHNPVTSATARRILMNFFILRHPFEHLKCVENISSAYLYQIGTTMSI